MEEAVARISVVDVSRKFSGSWQVSYSLPATTCISVTAISVTFTALRPVWAL